MGTSIGNVYRRSDRDRSRRQQKDLRKSGHGEEVNPIVGPNPRWSTQRVELSAWQAGKSLLLDVAAGRDRSVEAGIRTAYTFNNFHLACSTEFHNFSSSTGKQR